MVQHRVVSENEWVVARKDLLAKEKEFTRLRDELSAARRQLPWVEVRKPYVFEGPNGRESLAGLFAGRHQLIVQHFMFDPSWEAACKSCSFWADGYNGFFAHIERRDTTFVVVSQAPVAKLDGFKKRMGWTFKWVSSAGSDFNADYQVGDPPENSGVQSHYNYQRNEGFRGERPGISVFYRDDAGTIFHTYSCYARGLDMLNAAYHYLDLTPKGRDEDSLPFSMAWLRLHDEYAAK